MAIHNIGGFNYQLGMEMPTHLAGEIQEFASDTDRRIYEMSRGAQAQIPSRTPEEKHESQMLLEQALQMRIETQHARGLECLKKSASLGNGRALWELGCAYDADGDWGLNVNDQDECQKMFLLSAEAGYPAGLAHASKLVVIGADKPEKRIFSRLMLSAMALATNDPYAVGFCYQYGLGVPSNPERFWEQYKLAAIQGVAEAQIKIGKFEQIAEHLESADAWYKKAADQGRAFGQYNVGKSFYGGNGVANDLSAAFTNFNKASLGNIRFGSSQLINIQYYLPGNRVDGAKRLAALSKFFDSIYNFDGMEDFGMGCFAIKEHLISVWSERLQHNLIKGQGDDHLRELYQLGKGLALLSPIGKTSYVAEVGGFKEAYGDKYPEKVYHDSRMKAQKAALCVLGLRSKRPGTPLALLPKDLGIILGKMIWAMRDNPAPWLQNLNPTVQ